MRPPDPAPFGLVRESTGLTLAHRQLIRLLAERAVEQYLAEIEANTADEADTQVPAQ